MKNLDAMIEKEAEITQLQSAILDLQRQMALIQEAREVSSHRYASGEKEYKQQIQILLNKIQDLNNSGNVNPQLIHENVELKNQVYLLQQHVQVAKSAQIDSLQRSNDLLHLELRQLKETIEKLVFDAEKQIQQESYQDLVQTKLQKRITELEALQNVQTKLTNKRIQTE